MRFIYHALEKNGQRFLYLEKAKPVQKYHIYTEYYLDTFKIIEKNIFHICGIFGHIRPFFIFL